MEGFWLVSYLVLWAIVLVLVALQLGTLHQIGSLHERLDKVAPRISGFRLGEIVPDFTLPNFAGQLLTISSFSSKNIFLVFVSPTCSGCEELLLHLEEAISPEIRTEWQTLIVSLDDLKETDQLIAKVPDPFPLLIDHKNEVQRIYKIWGTPLVMALDKERMLMAQEIGPHWNWFQQVAGNGLNSTSEKVGSIMGSTERTPPTLVMRKLEQKDF